jgi:catechol 2,3-dioxygenase-like lactoylglutathione lyase family enzyme
MPLERLDHVAMLTADIERAAQFYCEWAGMEIVHDRRDPGHTHRVLWVRLKEAPGSLIIVFIESDNREPKLPHTGRMDHFGLHVSTRAEVDAIAERARAVGILVDEPQYAGPVVGYFCMIKDPDGNLVEFSCDQLKV